MNKDKHKECKRDYVRTSKAWYGKHVLSPNVLEEISIGFYCQDGSTTGEFTIVWKELMGKYPPFLHVFDDAWSALLEFHDLLEKLAELDNTNPTPDEICKVLDDLGIEDNTQYHRT